MMPDYRIRQATLADREVLVHHRVAMFRDMGLSFDSKVVGTAYGRWLDRTIRDSVYHAWVVENAGRRGNPVVAGGGLMVQASPPGPRSLSDRIAFVYNVYTEPAHRRRGLARLIMRTLHDWCRNQGIATIGLQASVAGRPLYESLGYRVAASPLMLCVAKEPQV